MSPPTSSGVRSLQAPCHTCTIATTMTCLFSLCQSFNVFMVSSKIFPILSAVANKAGEGSWRPLAQLTRELLQFANIFYFNIFLPETAAKAEELHQLTLDVSGIRLQAPGLRMFCVRVLLSSLAAANSKKQKHAAARRSWLRSCRFLRNPTPWRRLLSGSPGHHT